jgi:predicted deacylase
MMSSQFESKLQSYPIEIHFPDIGQYSTGNSGIPFVYTFDSGRPGRHVMINSLTHGNEVCGAVIVKALLDGELRPRVGRLTLSFANVEAYLSFDARHPDKARFVDQDFNRLWDPRTLDDMRLSSQELHRVRMLRPILDEVDLLLDLHSMHERSSPLIVAGPLEKGAELGRALGIPATIIRDAGHAEGCRMRDYGEFGDSGSAKNALLIECGQHWERRALDVARASTARFLELADTIERSDLNADWWTEMPSKHPSRVVQVTDAVVATSMNFEFAAPYTGLEQLPEGGTVIGWQDGEPIRTPYDNCILVMPSLRYLRPGATLVRLGRLQH